MKVKSITNGVFTNVNKGNIFKTYTKFAQLDETLNLEISEDTKALIKAYEDDAAKIEPAIQKLALMEDIIMLMRARNNISNVRIFTIRTYIYARATCYRSDTINQEIRAIVGNTTNHGEDLDSLFNNKEFMDNAILKLKNSITELIVEKTIKLGKLQDQLV